MISAVYALCMHLALLQAAVSISQRILVPHSMSPAVQAKHRPNPNYIAKRQIELTVQMRSILVDWMIEVSLEYNVSNDTLFLAVSCLDRFLSSQTVTRHQLQLAGTACLFIAAKYEETSPPTIHCFVDITDGTYTKADLLAMEQLVLQRIDYQLTLPTAKTFLRMLLHKCQADRPLYFLSSYIAELSLLEYKLLDAAPSKVAAAAFVWAHMCLQRPLAQHTVKVLSGYSYADLKRTLNQQASLHLAASAIGSSAVHLAVKDKYGSSDFHRVSRLAPANPHMLALL